MNRGSKRGDAPSRVGGPPPFYHRIDLRNQRGILSSPLDISCRGRLPRRIAQNREISLEGRPSEFSIRTRLASIVSTACQDSPWSEKSCICKWSFGDLEGSLIPRRFWLVCLSSVESRKMTPLSQTHRSDRSCAYRYSPIFKFKQETSTSHRGRWTLSLLSVFEKTYSL